ncbi:MAG: metallophosphoesterase [Acutalibacteraceae bacterium]
MKKGLKIFLSILLVLAIIGGTAILTVTFYGKKYVRAEDTAFSILQITDVHILNNEKKDAKAFKTITAMVETTKPDMIVVTGDVTSEKENYTAFKTFCTFMENFKIPWAFTFGNHEGLDIQYEPNEVLDPDKITDKKTLSDYLESLEYCIYECGDEDVDGMGNYYYTVHNNNNKALMSLIFMDSNSYDEANNGYDHFHENQIQWYENTIKQIAKEENGDESKVVPSLAFFHIPMQEYMTAYDEAKGTDNMICGLRFPKEDGTPAADDNMFEKMVELGSTKGCFAGHDHMNNYSVNYNGIRLTYGLSCDHNIYVVPFRGGTLINIKNDGSFTTQSLIRHRGQSTITVCKEK